MVGWSWTESQCHTTTWPQSKTGKSGKSKSEKTHGFRWGLFNKWKKKKEEEKFRSQSLPPPTSTAVPSQSPNIGTSHKRLSPLGLLLSKTLYNMEYPFVHLGQLSLFQLPRSFPSPACSLEGQSEKNRKPQCCASPVQQERTQCVIISVLVTNLKHSTIQASMKKMSSIPSRPSVL